MTSKELGDYGEKIAAYYLEKKGYKILSRNFRINGGEIDIISQKDDIIAFTEVKTRTPGFMTGGFEAVTKSKQRRIIKASEMYSLRHRHDFQPRFDVVEIIIDGKKVVGFNYIENAFDASDVKTIL